VEKALRERAAAGERLRVQLHDAASRFVAGQAQAVLQLLAGRENLPVTAWQPEAVSGHRGRPTLLSNAETFAHIGYLAGVGPQGYAAHGTADEPGTTLLTLRGDGMDPEVREVAYGTPLADVLDETEMTRPLLLGGYHGTWLTPAQLRGLAISRNDIATAGATLGAGVMLPLAEAGVRSCALQRGSTIWPDKARDVAVHAATDFRPWPRRWARSSTAEVRSGGWRSCAGLSYDAAPVRIPTGRRAS
jgi:NADH:ubiquinone oxidoreductase subunit F (NADH-binding)